MKKLGILWLLMTLFFTGCFNDGKKDDSGSGVALERRNNEVIVSAVKNTQGLELLVSGVVTSDMITTEVDKMVMTRIEGEKTRVLVARLDGTILKGEEIIKIISKENIKIDLIQSYDSEEFDRKNSSELKKALTKGVRASTIEELLGDFNQNGKVDLTDFEMFKNNYAGTDLTYDIAPAVKGSNDIYSVRTPDGKIDILDFVIFARNYGKSLVTKNVTSVDIVGSTSIVVGTEENYIATVKYSDGTSEQTSNLNWSSSDTAVATVDTTSGNAVLKAAAVGSIQLKAEKDGKVGSLTVNITAAEQKLYIETNQNVYAWNVNSSGAVEKLNGDWPGKPLVTTVTMTGHTWYLFDFTGKEGAMFIINGKGGETGTSISKSTWIKADNSIYYQDPYKPTKPIISISPGGGIVNDSNQEKVITIKVTALNAAVDQKSVVIGTKSVTLTEEESTIKISDYINNGETATIKVTASNVIGTTTKEITIKRDDSYVVPTGEFTWGNANVYFVLTDRFFNGNPSNDNSYGRKNKLSPAPLDVATYHGGDLAGLTKKIEDGYFSELGVSAIWFSAAYEQIHGWVGGGSGDFPHYPFHGYYALDWTMMDRNMGNIEEMRKFVNTAHKNNIRVVMDVVVNHAGYNTVMDMYDYGFSSYETSVINSRDWMNPMVASGWQSHHEKYVFYSAAQLAKNGVKPTPITDWLKWWGPDWVRTGIDGYSAGNGSELQNPLAGLPDIKTEVTDPVAMAPIMQTKWKLEAADGDDAYDTAIGGKYENYIVPAAKYLRNPDTKIAPADHVIKSLAAWVEEFGIDGFRCDTAKHIELSRWKQLQSECDASLKKWRAAHATDPASKWSDNFWMVGEHWDFKNGSDGGYFSNGFTTMLDFGFPLKNGGTGSTMISTWAGYSTTVNKAMPYLNSHDMGKVGFFGKGSSCIPAGTALLLNPSPVQIYYGDENDREKGPSCSDADMMLRSDYQWGANPDKLAHWQKVGKFRNLNPAVGAGTQTSLTKQANAIVRKWKDNIVVIVVSATGKMDIDVSEVTEWADGTKLRNGYNGEEATIAGGKVTFTGENGLILIENAIKIKR